ncbi:hypothetical protein X474_15645 [Dethiosulfatarculus sandiegensis]|uniref:Uncharacterized protein n=1 Tax=Dethiosulfatarculus sandiegensis TaxID=1429043 RepID=A0A0D2GDW0_9BACT|nr:hypothetical protein X474_15645 [Dethiosulfatarculus sandiegensis]
MPRRQLPVKSKAKLKKRSTLIGDQGEAGKRLNMSCRIQRPFGSFKHRKATQRAWQRPPLARFTPELENH